MVFILEPYELFTYVISNLIYRTQKNHLVFEILKYIYPYSNTNCAELTAVLDTSQVSRTDT